MILIGGLFRRLNTGSALPVYRFRFWMDRVSFLGRSHSQFVRKALSHQP